MHEGIKLRITNPTTGQVYENWYNVHENKQLFAGKQPLHFRESPDRDIFIDDPEVEIIDGEIMTYIVTAWLAGEYPSPQAAAKGWLTLKAKAEKAKRNAQNDFLKSKGYRWEKRSVYNSGPGEMQNRWFLLDADGGIVIGYRDGGFDLLPTGPTVSSLLTDLGYYGQNAVDKKQSDEAEATERKRMRSEVNSYFESMPSQTPDNFSSKVPPIQIESYMPRRQFRIHGDSLVLESHNTSDGDNWSLNNCDYGIAQVYPFDSEIAAYLRKLSVKSTEPTVTE